MCANTNSLRKIAIEWQRKIAASYEYAYWEGESEKENKNARKTSNEYGEYHDVFNFR